MTGFVTLGEIADRHVMLTVACNRCGRHGRVSVGRMIAEHGEDLPVPALRRILAADCPLMREAKLNEPCGVHFPGLAG